MKKCFKKILAAILVVVMLVPIAIVPASAASYPLILFLSTKSNTVIPQGEIGYLEFTILPEYHNEKYNVEVYDADGDLQASASSTYYNSDGTFFRDVSIKIDTGDLDLAVGEYTVVYYMEFYSLYEWHYAPNKYQYKIEVVKNVCKGNHNYAFSAVVDEAECDEKGLAKHVCQKCGAMKFVETPEQHTYNNVDTKLVCDTCGELELNPTIQSVGGEDRYFNNGEWEKKTGLLKCADGEFYYVIDGVVNKVTTLYKYAGKWYYLKEGKISKETTLVKYKGVWYYVKNGVKNNSNTLVKYNGKWYHVNGGKWVKDTTLVKYGGVYYYVKDGVRNTANTLVKYGSKWYHVNGGKWVKDTTLVKYSGKWYYVKNGVVNFNYSGKVYYKGNYYTVKKGIKV